MARLLYSPIDSKNGQIRLLELLPGRSTTPIECRMQHASLDNAPPYRALSYTWGTKGADLTITVNDQIIGIFENLEAALRRLRREAKPRTLWIDAICINQDDIDERAEQVKLMRQIYENTTQVYI
ncbi:HET-domain-containing protein [Xylariaceae sp. AK1471]|nr:HET-domain-containing protein [Xylariaceae sp. AK1471]